jgi:cobalamin biosynthetic protein CobC
MQQNPAIEAQALAGAGHGGDLSAARRAFPFAPEPWLDLSTGVSPYAYPVADLPAEAWTRLPDPAALRALERAAAKLYRAHEGAATIAAPGTQAIIGLLPHLRPARRVGILGFTYSEHAIAWRTSGAEAAIVHELAELADMDVAIVVNPNNPNGRLVAASELRALAGDLAGRGGLLIVDEAFMDFLDPAASIIPEMPAGVVALRSFGKAYGLPGLRLGFAIAPHALAAKLRAALGCWPVSGAALAIGAKALADQDWLAATGQKLAGDAAALDEILKAAGFDLVGGGPLFRLAARQDAAMRFEALARAGILVRRFDARPSWLRFGIPGGDADRWRLRAALGLGQAQNHADQF